MTNQVNVTMLNFAATVPEKHSELLRLMRCEGAVTFYKRILTNRACGRDDITAADLIEAGLSEASAYRVLKGLQRSGLIKFSDYGEANPNGGPRPKIWRLA